MYGHLGAFTEIRRPRVETCECINSSGQPARAVQELIVGDYRRLERRDYVGPPPCSSAMRAKMAPMDANRIIGNLPRLIFSAGECAANGGRLRGCVAFSWRRRDWMGGHYRLRKLWQIT